MFAQKRIFGAPDISSFGNLSVRARGSARSETGMRIVSDWLVSARGVGVGDADGEVEGEPDVAGFTLGDADASALVVGSGDAESDGVTDAEGLAAATGD